MSDKTIVIDRYTTDANQLHDWHNKGYKLICPLCKSELVFQRSGIWCPKNVSHFEVHEYIRNKESQNRQREEDRRESIANMKRKGYTEAQIQMHIDKYYPETSKS